MGPSTAGNAAASKKATGTQCLAYDGMAGFVVAPGAMFFAQRKALAALAANFKKLAASPGATAAPAPEPAHAADRPAEPPVVVARASPVPAVKSDKAEAVEMVGLYWHFVDIVWIIIFTLVYLIPA